MEYPWRFEPDGLLLTIRLTPRGGRDSIGGQTILPDGRPAILARVREVPENGTANAALLKLIAKSVGVPVSAARIISGHASRLKTVRLSGDPESIASALIDCLSSKQRDKTAILALKKQKRHTRKER